MPAGRPTKYTPDLIDKAHQYLHDWADSGHMIPSHEGLQEYIGISNTCMYEWAQHPDKTEFKEILEKILIKQRLELLNKGLSGDFNSNITKLVLGKHGYSEKKETTQTVSLTDLSEEELDRRLRELENKAEQSGSD